MSASTAKKHHLLIADSLHPAGLELLSASPDVCTSGPFTTRTELLAAAREADALIVKANTGINRELLDSAPKLKVIGRAGARIDNIDIDAASRRGVMVINVPEANVVAVVEHTFALLLTLARNLPSGCAAVRHGEWPQQELLGFELAGKTLGVVGFGRQGRAVAARAQAFEMRVLVYDPYIDLSLARQQGVEIVDFPELLARADILSLHTAYGPQTHHLMDAATIAQMKPGAYLINCAHAGLVNEPALATALTNGNLAGAALDLLQQEPPAADHPLIDHPSVIISPHLHQNTVEAQTATARQVIGDTLAALRGEDYGNVINLPFNERAPYKLVRPYVRLAEKLGKLQGQVAEGWITRVEVELLGAGLREYIRPVAAVLLSGMLRATNHQVINWVSAPIIAHEQGIVTAQAKNLVDLADYPNLIACRIHWQGGQRTVAGALFGNGEARLVMYEDLEVDAYPEGYVLILENDDLPGVIGGIGTRLGQAGINIAQWRYGREAPGGRSVSFLNLDSRVPEHILADLVENPVIKRARQIKL